MDTSGHPIKHKRLAVDNLQANAVTCEQSLLECVVEVTMLRPRHLHAEQILFEVFRLTSSFLKGSGCVLTSWTITSCAKFVAGIGQAMLHLWLEPLPDALSCFPPPPRANVI